MTAGRSISFGAPMVLALLAGRKAQTRRLVKPQPATSADTDAAPVPARCPYGAAGQRLWVREAFRLPSTLDTLTPSAAGSVDASADPGKPLAVPVEYPADGARRGWHPPCTPGRLRSPMFMPRWASRLELEVTAVRIERLQAISAADALAEGVTDADSAHAMRGDDGAIALYRAMWERIHGAGAWAVDPWVWVVSFQARPVDGQSPVASPGRRPAQCRLRPAHRQSRLLCAKF